MPQSIISTELRDDDAARILEWQKLNTERDCDFDTNSAFAEILDNSTAANSEDSSITTKNIIIDISSTTSGKGRGLKAIVDKAVFMDDGIGMEEDALYNCLVKGYSSRYNDRSGIGRFGTGLTLAAIFQNKRVDMFSKTINSEWQKVTFDMTGDPKKDPSPKVSDPVIEKPKKEYLEKINNSEHGTILVLSEFDKITDSFEYVVNELHIFIGRSFRHFIWGSVSRFDNIKNNINFILNDKKIYAIDPLYLINEETEYPHDELADEWKVESVDVPTDENPELTTAIDIKMSLLPLKWRERKGSGNQIQKDFQTSRHITRNTGISILRKGREVFYGDPPRTWDKDSLGASNKGWGYQMNRYWGCEIAFDPACDRSFVVKNIKRGALPILELRKVLERSSLRPVIAEMSAIITKDWDDWEKENNKKTEKKKRTGEDTQGVIDGDPVKDNPQSEKDDDKIIDGLAGKYPEEQWEELFKAHAFLVQYEAWEGDRFAETLQRRKGLVVIFNQYHTLVKKMETLQGIVGDNESTRADLIRAARDYQSVLELLIFSYGKVQMKYSKDEKFTTKALFEDFLPDWGYQVRKYIERLDESKMDDGDDEE